MALHDEVRQFAICMKHFAGRNEEPTANRFLSSAGSRVEGLMRSYRALPDGDSTKELAPPDEVEAGFLKLYEWSPENPNRPYETYRVNIF